MALAKQRIGNMQLMSAAFREGANIPMQYTCKGQNVNPPLNFIDVPADAKSLALIVHDPDAVNKDFTHWVMWDMPAGTETIAANSVPVGAVQGLNDAGKTAYMGPCPPVGTGVHRYMFELYALDQPMTLPDKSGRSELEKSMTGHIIEQYSFTGVFGADEN